MCRTKTIQRTGGLESIVCDVIEQLVRCVEALDMTEQFERAETETTVVTGIEVLDMTEQSKRAETETPLVTEIEALDMTEQPKRAET